MRKVSAIGFKAALLLVLGLSMGQGWAGIWQARELSAKGVETDFPARLFAADRAALKQALADAPLEETTSQGAELELPLPDGSLQRFAVENSPVMAPELADRYPRIQSYRVKGIDDPAITGRLDMSPGGFHAMLTTPQGVVLIDPEGSEGYLSYFARDYRLAAKRLPGEASPSTCLVGDDQQVAYRSIDEYALRTSGSRRIYRLAVAATAEYTAFHGGTIPSALAAIVTAINRVNEIYGRDLNIGFELVANNDAIIYTDASTDPYTNDDGVAMLTENQTNLDDVIGSANYDVGHVFSTGGGGIAVVGCGCQAGVKAKGVTGRPDPVDDIFYIDLVAHELGHQLDAVHSFNGTTDNCVPPNRIAESAVEPGSGSTIMAYAGLCGAENLQTTSDATFHGKSIREILTYTTSPNAGATCGTLETIANTAPTVSAGSDYTIPFCTPFSLRPGYVTDSEGDPLSFQWDEMDAGEATDATTFGTDLGTNALFRSYLPKPVSERVLPRVSALVNGTDYKGEALPAAGRTLNFRLTVRDGKGGVNEDDVQILVDGSQGPFRITGGTMNSVGRFTPGQRQSIEWLTADTPATCPVVNVSLLAFDSTHQNYCDSSNDSRLNLGNFDNTGFASVLIPDLEITTARVKVACASNIYLSLSAADIEILGSGLVATDCKSADYLPAYDGSGDLVTACLGQVPEPPPSGGGGGGALSWLVLLLAVAWLAGPVLSGRFARSS
jgi:hypothetical protein